MVREKIGKMLQRWELPESVVKNHFMKIKSAFVSWQRRWKEKMMGKQRRSKERLRESMPINVFVATLTEVQFDREGHSNSSSPTRLLRPYVLNPHMSVTLCKELIIRCAARHPRSKWIGRSNKINKGSFVHWEQAPPNHYWGVAKKAEFDRVISFWSTSA